MASKKRIRDISYSDYGISKQRYKELLAFCRQYDEKKKKIHYGLSAVTMDGQPRGKGLSDPTQEQAIKNAQYSKDIKMIEEAAQKASKEAWQYILRSVTKGLSYEKIIYDKDGNRIPMSQTEFYAHRRLFYHYLDKMKMGSN